MARRKDRNRGHGRRSKPTAIRLTDALCREAEHSGAGYVGAAGRRNARQEILWDVELRGLGLRLLPTGRKTWVLRYRHEGRQRIVKLADFGLLTLEEARQRARKAQVKVFDGEDPFADGDESLTLEQFAPQFEEHCRQRARCGEIRQSTAHSYLDTLRNVLRVLGDRKLGEIDEMVTRRAFATWTREDGPYAANHGLGVLRFVLRLAGELGYRNRREPDPTLEIKPHREARRGREFSEAELTRIGAALDAEVERRPEAADTAAAIRLLAFTGARRREITDLLWGEVDLAGMKLRLRMSKTGPKAIALNTAAATLLARLHEAAPATGSEDRVFPPVHHEVGHAVGYTWKRVRKAADLPSDSRLHDLRHTYVTRGIAANFSEALVGRAVGHASPATTRRYTHVSVEPTRVLVEHVGGEIAAALSGTTTRPEPPTPLAKPPELNLGPWIVNLANEA